MGSMAARGIYVVTILLVLGSAVATLKRWQKRMARRARSQLVVGTGNVSIVYFHSSSCGVCQASQKPILDRLLAQVGASRLKVVAVDVNEKMEIARDWGVTTLPTTYVFDAAGEVAHVNSGLATERTLRRQVS
jgi:thiol-disulfide isomerase/thioredoxin